MSTASRTKELFTKHPFGKRLKKAFQRDKFLWLIILPGILWYLLFTYVPMYGLVIAFKDFSPYKSIAGSAWVGLKWFRDFYNSKFFWQLLRNTFVLNFGNLLFSFPLPIVLALMLNEVKNKYYRKFAQTVSYLPHFISTVVVIGIMVNFVSSNGIINQMIVALGGEKIPFLVRPEWFRPLYTISNIWQSTGWNAIIYIAALAGVDQELYEAAVVDGASKFKQLIHITLPCIMPTVIIMLILALGNILSVGHEKIILMYNPSIYETADVINTFVYRRGIGAGEFSFGTAVGLFQSIINLIFLFTANKISKKVSDVSLW